MLYKFAPPNEYTLKNLKERKFICRHFSEFNDPFEFWGNLKRKIPSAENEEARFKDALKTWGFTPESLNDLNLEHEEYFESLADGAPDFGAMYDYTRIACFGSDIGNLLMWSHYADGLRGLCLELDFDLDVIGGLNKSRVYMTSVRYTNTPPVVDAFNFAVAEDQIDYHVMAIEEAKQLGDTRWVDQYKEVLEEESRKIRDSIWDDAFATKPVEWEYEQEKRLLVYMDSDNGKPEFMEYPKGALKRIVLGEKMPEEFREAVMELVKKYCSDVPVWVATRSSKCFQIKLEQFDPQ